MSQPFIHTRMVEFADTDAAGLMHFANFFRFMESAEHAYLRSLGFSVHTQDEKSMTGFVRVHVECDYRRPLHFEDTVDIELRVREMNDKSIIYDFIFRKEDQTEAAKGSMTVVCARKFTGSQEVRAIEIPADLAKRIAQGIAHAS